MASPLKYTVLVSDTLLKEGLRLFLWEGLQYILSKILWRVLSEGLLRLSEKDCDVSS